MKLLIALFAFWDEHEVLIRKYTISSILKTNGYTYDGVHFIDLPLQN